MSNDLELEKGLTFYYSHEAEFERREIPIEKQVAIAYEAGIQAGRYELSQRVSKTFKPNRSGGEWA